MAQKNITLGLVAQVDSGKTTLPDAMRVEAGALTSGSGRPAKSVFVVRMVRESGVSVSPPPAAVPVSWLSSVHPAMASRKAQRLKEVRN